ncbi:kinesin-like protein KIF18A isoform X2 [Melanerpes formicivorus]|uniref:kinesin-like protein KIF18A isoform X2 n=1 Tax=Melanerpes formicivorus TaxID=211600 RepID=UPI00358E9D77
MSAAKEDDGCNHVKVVVRVRPESQKEKNGNFSKVVRVVDQHILVFDPKEEEVSFFHRKKSVHRDINKRKQKDLKFMFDAVFDESSSQMEVFENTTKSVIDGFLNGYNCTVLAYGATGAGKTHTMLGSPEDPGVMYLTMMALYNCIEQIKEDKICNIAVSYLEPKSAEEILQMLDYGNKNRTQHPTDVNASSSRSHAIFQIYLRQQDKTASITQNVRIAKMSLIDLAGSERASATNAKGARFREGTNINRSLLALGNVINALANPKSKQQHIPYRNSKLTRLLKDSLGGNCRTIMIAAVSPSSMFYDDTYNTLKYANRAKDIKSSLKSNVVSLDSHIVAYAKICNEQKKEILMLKEKLRQYEEKQASLPESCNAAALSNKQVEIDRYKEILKNVFANREELRKEYLRLEMKLKENKLKTHYQKQCHEQVQLLCSEERVEKATCKRDQRLAMLRTHHIHMQKKKEEHVQHFEENTNWLHRVENEMRLLSQDGSIPKELSKDLQCCHLNLEVKDLKAQLEHTFSLASLQDQHYKQTEKVLNTLLPVLRKQYLTLKEAGLTNDVTETEYREVEQLIQRPKSVVWADQTEEQEQNQNGDLKLSAMFAFPQLVIRQSTPCYTTSGTPSQETNKNTQQIVECVVPQQKRTRRKLMDSPVTAPSPAASKLSSLRHLEDSLTKEVRPIVYTPDLGKKPQQSYCTQTVVKKALHLAGLQEVEAQNMDRPVKKPSITDPACDTSSEYDEADMNSTVILYELTDETAGTSTDSSLKESQPSNNTILQRLGLSTLNKNLTSVLEKPSYMAMTSAAERKRKIPSSTSSSGLGNPQEVIPAKRGRQELSLSHRALRVPKVEGNKARSWKQEQDMPGNLVKSLSEGNIALSVKPRASKKLLLPVFKKKSRI